MTRRKTGKLTIALILTGVLLILSALAIAVIGISLEKTAEKNAAEIADRIGALLPESKNAEPDDRADKRMASVSIDGVDFCAIIEIPRFGTKLPVRSVWDSSSVRMYPCRYSGSVHDSTLIIGGSDARGQFDFVSEITERDILLVTDTEGKCHSYEVGRIDITQSADTPTLTEGEYSLVLFARNTYGDGYTVIRCEKRAKTNA